MSAETGAPLDPLIWAEGGIRTTYPACMAVRAAAEQGTDGGVRLPAPAAGGDHVRAAEARPRRGAGREPRARRAWTWSGSGSACARTRSPRRSAPTSRPPRRWPPSRARGRRSPRRAPAERRCRRWCSRVRRGRETVSGLQPLEAYRRAAEALRRRDGRTRASASRRSCAASAASRPREVEVLCDLPGPRAHAELWRLAESWQRAPGAGADRLAVGGGLDGSRSGSARKPSLVADQPDGSAAAPTPASSVTSPITRGAGMAAAQQLERRARRRRRRPRSRSRCPC